MRSLRGRLVLSVTLVLIVSVLLTTLALERAFHDAARSSREERLLAQLYLLMAAAEVEDDQLVLPDHLDEPRLSLPGSGLSARIFDDTGSAVWESASALTTLQPEPVRLPPGEFRVTEGAGAERGGSLVGVFGVSWATGPVPINYTFAVAEDLAELNREVAGFRVSLWRWLGAMSVLMLLALALILGWGLRPLRRVAAEVAAVESGRQRRIEGVYPAELGLLTDNLNALLAQEHARQQRLDHALGDLAHSLKTPMAVMSGVIDEFATDVPGRRVLHEQLARMREIVEYQLRRARAGATQIHGLGPRVSMRRTAERLAASLAKVYREKSVTLELALEGDPAFKGSESDLMELLGNLLDNAYKWCRGRVRLAAGQVQGHLQISVEDDGPGIGSEEAERLMERGVRADETAPGHGLGLAVARQIVLAYGGSIEIGHSSLGGAALRVVIGVPAAGGRGAA